MIYKAPKLTSVSDMLEKELFGASSTIKQRDPNGEHEAPSDKVSDIDALISIRKVKVVPTTMQRDRNRARGDIFSKIYLRVLVISGSIALVLLALLWFYLADYQRLLPSNFAQQMLESFRTADTNTLRSVALNIPETLADDAVLETFLRENISNTDLYFYNNGGTGNGIVRYSLISDDRKIAELELAETGVRSLFGNEKYEVKSLKLLPVFKYVINAQSGAAIKINGVPLSESYFEGEVNYPHCFSAACDATYLQRVYKLDQFNYVETVSATMDGKDCDINFDRKTGDISIILSPDAATTVELHEFCERASKEYAYFALVNSAPRGPVLALLWPDTRFYHAVQNYDNSWGQYYDSSHYDDLKIDNFRQYSDSDFSCDISFDYVIKNNYLNSEKSYPFDMTVCVTRRTGSWRVVEMMIK
ncbi:MAG: hypothetical protein RR998_05735 [Oscillospiraceae bacterium]